MMAYYSYALLAAIFWGAGFIGSRFGLEALSPMWVTFFRFLVAFLATLPVLVGMKKIKIQVEMILGSFICATILASMIFLQIKGLQYTTVAKSGFITILYAFFTPILCKIIYGDRLSNFYWMMLSVALVGMGFICEMNLGTLNEGDLITLVCAFFSALHILAISHFVKETTNVMVFNILQMFFVCLVSLPIALYLEGADQVISGHFLMQTDAVVGLIFMGVFSTSVAFFMQIKAQEKLPAHVASLIFLMESPFAAVFGFMAFNETLSQVAVVGSVLVTVSVCLMPFEKKIRFWVRRNVVFTRKLAIKLSTQLFLK